MSPQKVLLTGGTGSLGTAVLDELLANGHSVVAVIRSLKKSQKDLTEKYAGKPLTLLEVPDLTTPNVFDEAAVQVDAIIHIATPLSADNFEETLIKPTLVIDESILEAAHKSPSVKRVIFCSSIVTLAKLPDQLVVDTTYDETHYNPLTLEEGRKNLPSAYQYAKTQAELEAWEFMKTKKPSFDLVTLLAPSITGASTQPGYIPTKDQLGGMSNIFKALFDVETPGFVFPYIM
jgi:NADPH-dependent methylglyoxal reductase